ncbi:hypothetical protein [Acetobacter orleanensis]|uniref:Uncharacterized protein n=1 Tax=Acetobacter orleanensis TaxID=104099 RepID=A0A4Y3TKX3_9PROT|nr:hypothetical protein [Acetobacter orleanensis]KXV65878.1 hypothetical protein AD949_03695 [Acetobacter orleanensis]PCD79778.1 hypothetical protein CO710_06210 [Acetobacter orleanensis]GAN69085.1 hypothetical protein Abol_025_017 [Acetobacter orleanensis JCM 7639]GBR28504.1 hypothetical protein AA0473_1773 [Acetobacter orleanensis NRIC 0473]GEB83631.1 hypothetical protein AOR01nite_21080 [Acetobacter orleanensis]
MILEKAAPSGLLFQYDTLLVWKTLTITFRRWRDRLTVAAVLLAGLLVLHLRMASCPWRLAAGIFLAIGFLGALTVLRSAAARLSNHITYGLLAPEALTPSLRRRYLATWCAIGLGSLTALTLIIRPSLLIVCVPGYLAGSVLGFVGLSKGPGSAGPDHAGAFIQKHPFFSRFRRPAAPYAGLVCALGLLAVADCTRLFLPPAFFTPVLMTVATLMLFRLSATDHAVVKFLCQSGSSPLQSIQRTSGDDAAFLLAAGPAAWSLYGWFPAVLILALCVTAGLLKTLWIWTACCHDKKRTDLIMTCETGVLILTGYEEAVLLPAVLAFFLWISYRRAAARTWLMP